MPIIGSIAKGQLINKHRGNNYIWQACKICGKERWVKTTFGKPDNTMCLKCSLQTTPIETKEKQPIGTKRSYLGLAGELRVMSELLLRGHNPAKSYLELGSDLILENGTRVEVKSGSVKKHGFYSFNLSEQHATPFNCDYIICWCVNHDLFYIIPQGSIPAKAFCLKPIYDPKRKNGHKQNYLKYERFREDWEQLGTKRRNSVALKLYHNLRYQ